MLCNNLSDVRVMGWLVMPVMALALLSGCASKPPPRFADGVIWTAHKHKVYDAKTQEVNGQPGLRMDAVLLDRLDTAMKQQELSEAKSQSLALLDDAHATAMQSTGGELARLSDAAWADMVKRYFSADATVDDSVKQQLAEAFRKETDLQVWFLRRQIEQASDLSQVRAVLGQVKKETRESIKTAGRAGRAAPYALLVLPSKLVQGSIHEQEPACQLDGKFEAVVHFSPPPDPTHPVGRTLSPSEARHWDALLKHAPLFVQEEASEISYPAEDDAIGEVRAEDDGAIQIDTQRPVVYGYTRTVLLGDVPHVQLIYAIWYPEHPKLRTPVDPEAGKIDGATIRITLDSKLRPAVVETLNNCGCHHRIYPASWLEEQASQEYGRPIEGKLHAIERDVKGKYDLIIPKLIDPSADERPIVRCRAGTHAVVDVDFIDRRTDEPVSLTRAYELRSYDELEQLRTPNGRTVSMFLDNGLVRGAERLEGAIFTPLGMLSAGQPRQRGTQLINWDQFDFDDPRLLERTLRLPRSF